jgi:uncharacterized protein
MPRIDAAKQFFITLLLPLAAIVGSVQVFRLLLLPSIQSLFHLDDSATSLLRRTGIFLCVFTAYWAYVKFYEKRAATELRVAPIGIAAGAILGALLILIATLPMFAFGVYQVTSYRGPQAGLFGVAAVILIAAFMEEVIYRGVLFRALEEAIGTNWALWLQALIFSAAHIGNNSDADIAVTLWNIMSVTLIGALWTYIFIQTRNLWIVAANHAAWNYAIILTGTPLSGIDAWRSVAPFDSTYHGPFWLSGGVYGPEDSIVTIFVVIVCLVIQMKMQRKSKREALAANLDSAIARVTLHQPEAT